MEDIKETPGLHWLGSWRNQYGSILIIESQTNGNIKGIFRSAVDPAVKASTVIGICNKDLIAFIVSGEAEGQKIAAWTGVLHDERIETLWHLVANEKLVAAGEGVPAEKKPLGIWEAFKTGADIFERIK